MASLSFAVSWVNRVDGFRVQAKEWTEQIEAVKHARNLVEKNFSDVRIDKVTREELLGWRDMPLLESFRRNDWVVTVTEKPGRVGSVLDVEKITGDVIYLVTFSPQVKPEYFSAMELRAATLDEIKLASCGTGLVNYVYSREV